MVQVLLDWYQEIGSKCAHLDPVSSQPGDACHHQHFGRTVCGRFWWKSRLVW